MFYLSFTQCPNFFGTGVVSLSCWWYKLCKYLVLNCFAGKKKLQNEYLFLEKTGSDTPQDWEFSIHNFLSFLIFFPQEILSQTHTEWRS